jgi:hypothetical protein
MLALAFGCTGNQQFRKSDKENTRVQIIDPKGGHGYEDAVVILHARDQSEIMDAEYKFISTQHGKKGKDWRVNSQTLQKEGDKTFDVVEIQLLKEGQMHYHYFDVTACKTGQLINREKERIEMKGE